MKKLKDNIYLFECNVGAGLYSQRNNQISWPSKKDYPNSQYTVDWRNSCNATSMINALAKSGWKFPDGSFDQPEDNFLKFTLENNEVLEKYKKSMPLMYNAWMKSLEGKCSKQELSEVYSPNELHDILSFSANKWLYEGCTRFSTTVDFKKALFDNMVKDNLPIVCSVNFQGFSHIIVVTGVAYKADNNKINCGTTPEFITIDDPYGKYDPVTDKYIQKTGGAGIQIPWNIVVKRFKPLNSQTVKWAHQFTHGAACI